MTKLQIIEVNKTFDKVLFLDSANEPIWVRNVTITHKEIIGDCKPSTSKRFTITGTSIADGEPYVGEGLLHKKGKKWNYITSFGGVMPVERIQDCLLPSNPKKFLDGDYECPEKYI